MANEAHVYCHMNQDKMTLEQDYRFICSEDHCGKRFRRRDRLLIHLRTHTGERPFKCKEPGCEKSYCRQSHLRRHHHNAHGPASLEKITFLCVEEGCTREFTQEHNLQKHCKRLHGSKIVHKYKCEEDGCGAIFRKHQQLRAHSYSHTYVNPFCCPHPECYCTFQTTSKLHRHSKIHQGYSCDKEGCNLTFYKWTELRQHKSEDHLEEFPCEKCSKTFPKKHLLNVHLRSHHEEKTVLPCPYDGCERMYWDKKNLKAHIASYHEGKHFVCDEPHCKKTYASKQKLNEHMKTHSPDYIPPAKATKAVGKNSKKPGRKKKSIASQLSGVCDREVQHHDLFDPVMQEGENDRENRNHHPRSWQSSPKSEREVLQAVLKVKLHDYPSRCTAAAASTSGHRVHANDSLVSGARTSDESI